MEIQVYPLEKVVLDGVPIALGMERSAVEAAIGPGELVRKRHYYFHSDLAIDYSPAQTVEFIEFLGGIDGTLHPEIYGVPAFEVPADQLTDLLRQKNAGEPQDDEHGQCYVFRNISVGLCRESVSSNVQEMIEEMKAEGIPVEGNKAIAEEMRKANHWATLGVGAAGYYG